MVRATSELNGDRGGSQLNNKQGKKQKKKDITLRQFEYIWKNKIQK